MSQSGTSSLLPLDRRGTTALEMGVVAPVFFMLLLGGFETTRYYFASESVHQLVGEVARAAMVNPDADIETLKSTYIERAATLQPDKLNLNINVVRASAPTPTTITVTASYDHFVAYAKGRTDWSNIFQPIDAAVQLSVVVPPRT